MRWQREKIPAPAGNSTPSSSPHDNIMMDVEGTWITVRRRGYDSSTK